jgi:chaperonin GroES
MNDSGIHPVEFKVLIKPVAVEDKTQGGIFIPDSLKEKNKYATDKGTLLAVGAIAFTEPSWLECPQVGDTVLFDRYAGGLVKGVDGEEYRLINDKEIQAVLR